MPFEAQSGTIIYESDMRSVYDAARHWGVINGMNVITGGALNVITQAGSWYNGSYRTQTGTAITLTAADATNPRLDLIYASGAGVYKLDGTAAVNPDPPITPASGTRLGIVRVPAAAGSVVPTNLTDARAFVSPLTRMHVFPFSISGNTAAVGNQLGSVVFNVPGGNGYFMFINAAGSSVPVPASSTGLEVNIQGTMGNQPAVKYFSGLSLTGSIASLPAGCYNAPGAGSQAVVYLAVNQPGGVNQSGTCAGSLFLMYSLE